MSVCTLYVNVCVYDAICWSWSPPQPNNDQAKRTTDRYRRLYRWSHVIQNDRWPTTKYGFNRLGPKNKPPCNTPIYIYIYYKTYSRILNIYMAVRSLPSAKNSWNLLPTVHNNSQSVTYLEETLSRVCQSVTFFHFLLIYSSVFFIVKFTILVTFMWIIKNYTILEWVNSQSIILLFAHCEIICVWKNP